METEIHQWTDQQFLEEARGIRYAYLQKRNLRYHTKRDLTTHSESVAEHIFALIFLLEYFLPLEDPDGLLDYRTLVQILLYHDFPEIPYGDVPYVYKTKAHEEQERLAAIDVYQQLPATAREVAKSSWEAYEERKSAEAQFAYALDKIEPLFELFDPVNEATPRRLQQTYESHIDKKLEATKNYPYMRRFIEVLSEDMRKRQVFWSKNE